jgi:hypothetical protein
MGGWAYSNLGNLGYEHEIVCKDADVGDNLFLPRCHKMATLIKRWLLGTHQGGISNNHLDYYLDEYTFRFNRRTSISRGKVFYRLLQQAVITDPTPYSQLIKGVRGPKKMKHNMLGVSPVKETPIYFYCYL